MKQKYKRNPYRIINKSHQYRFLALILIYIIIITGVLVSVLFVPDIIRMNDQSLSIEVRTVAAENILMLHYRVWPVIIAFICVIGLHSIRTFNRFIGPLYRFDLTFRDVCNGNLDNRIRLRKGDFLLQEADVINEMFDVISEKIKNIQEKGETALTALNDYEQWLLENIIKNGPDTYKITMLRQNLNELIDSAKYFKTR
jgi:methyl-accepting chemotaxis protein